MYKEGAFPALGYRFQDREEVTGWARIHQSIHGQPGIERQLLKTEGRPTQKWMCSTLDCPGILKLHYPEGTRTSGIVMETGRCSCPVLKNPTEEKDGNIARRDAKKLRAALVRFFQWDAGVPLADYRATSPRGFLGNRASGEVQYLYENNHQAVVEAQASSGGKRRRCAPKVKFFFGKLLDDRWFRVVMQEVLCSDGSRHWMPVKIPNPEQAATRLQPLPMPKMTDIVVLDCPESIENTVESAKTSNGIVCMTCQTQAATNKLCCPTEGCEGGVLCSTCTLQYACTRPSSSTAELDGPWFEFIEEQGVPCLYRCSSRNVTHMVAIGDEEKTKLPLIQPICFCLKRPARTLRDVADIQWAMDTFVAPIHKDLSEIYGKLVIEDSRLEALKQELDACNSQDALQGIQFEIDLVEQKMSDLRAKKLKYKFPGWALDWTMSEPYPKLADLTPADGKNGPTSQQVAQYLDGFDVGVNPTKPSGSVPALQCKGPLWRAINELDPFFIWGAARFHNLQIRENTQPTEASNMVIDLVSDTSNDTSTDMTNVSLDASDSDYEPSGSENESLDA